jgi:hypothetical protein
MAKAVEFEEHNWGFPMPSMATSLRTFLTMIATTKICVIHCNYQLPCQDQLGCKRVLVPSVVAGMEELEDEDGVRWGAG